LDPEGPKTDELPLVPLDSPEQHQARHRYRGNLIAATAAGRFFWKTNGHEIVNLLSSLSRHSRLPDNWSGDQNKA
jgi:hypothetical protein